ncbi:MAG: nickel-responsive transcriptional regulator NikR [Candidatus Aenigmarchaeota archaeon]|nr:nickel-responsive transcriptional regulator NikR [Candidatus Aenigmarchaeota archaeon]
MTVDRVGVSFEPELLEKFDRLIKGKGYGSRSEAIRDLVRKSVIESEISLGTGDIIGTVTMMYDHHAGGVTDRLLDIQHHSHANIVSTTHMHASEHICLEVIVVKGRANAVKELSDSLKAVKGVKHAELVMTKKDV